jgi:predicted Zn finger-like uncharacterized protein
MFKVVPDQLRISDGWVRCGQCDEVFDANAHLYTEPEVSSVLEVAPSELATENDNTWVSSLQFDAPRGSDVAVEELAAEAVADEPIVDLTPEEIAPDLMLDTPEVDEPSAPALDQVMNLIPGLPPDVAPQAEKPQEVVAPVAPAPRYAQAQVKSNESADPQKLSFMRQARRRSLWQHIAVRLSLGVLSLALLAALVVQLVVLERDLIAATEPDSRASLDALCEMLDCQIQPLRKIDAVVIDSSAFSKVQGDVYRLNFTLKNTSAVPLGVPALELTLTDMQDQPVLRRVVQAKELSGSKAAFEPGSEMSVALPLQVKAGGDGERISGYRLLAFYP